MSYGDYVEQLTFLLFLKMADEQSRPPFNKPSAVPKEFAWSSLLARDGDELETHYRHVLESLGKQKGMLGVIFRKAQNKIQDPAKLRRLIVDLIDKPGPGPGDTWSSLSADVKGDAYEGLLQKNAEDVKGGAGQYFTLRPLIAADGGRGATAPGNTICDPACGTGGFLLAAHDYIARMPGLDKAQKKRLKNGTLFGIELVDSVTRLCAMNLLLHGIGGADGDIPISDADLPVVTRDALANPPFGKKSSVTIVNEAGEQSKESLIINRDDFWASTSKCEPHWHRSSIFSNTLSPSSSSTDTRRWWCRTTRCSSAARARPSGANCSSRRTCIHCCACPPASSTHKAVRAGLAISGRAVLRPQTRAGKAVD